MTESVRKLREREESTTVIWELKGWGHGERNDLEVLEHLNDASCLVDVGAGATNGSPVARLRFYLKQERRRPGGVIAIDSTGVGHGVEDPYYLIFCAEQLFNVGNQVFEYQLKGNLVDEQFKVFNELPENVLKTISSSTFAAYNERRDRAVDYRFTKLYFGYLASRRPANLRIKLFVKSILNHETSAETLYDLPHCHYAVPPSIRFSQALDEQMLTFDKNFGAIINLETKDGEILSVCQILLAARSPVLRELIETELNNCKFSGTLKLDVNAKPMRVILHWIYTEKLAKNAGECMREVVDAGLDFRMDPFLKILDKKMIKFCNPDNMLVLYQIALRNSLYTAAALISKFVQITNRTEH